MIVDSVQRWRSRRDSYRPAGETIATLRYEVAAIADDTTPKRFVFDHHYDGSYPNARDRFGLYRAGELVGVAVFADPFPRAVARLEIPGAATELSRFVLLDDVPGNGETWFLARCFELLRCHVDSVLSFSDPMPRRRVDGSLAFRGHVGTIYQAFNGVYRGQAPRRTIRLLPDGHVFSARAISKIRAGDKGWRYSSRKLEAFGATRLEAPELGRAWLATWLPRLTRPVRHPGNHGYLWALDRRLRRSLGKPEPYPKLDVRPHAIVRAT